LGSRQKSEFEGEPDLSQEMRSTQSDIIMKTCIVDYLNAKYADLLDIASLVDPRFRDKYIPSDKIDAVKKQAVLGPVDI